MSAWTPPIADLVELMNMWAHTTTMMQIRIKSPDEGLYTRDGDLHLFTMAGRQVYRFALAISRNCSSGQRASMTSAIADFDKTSPDLKTARDVLDHWDDYLMGRGQGKHLGAGAPSTYQTDWLAVARPTQLWNDPVGDNHRLKIQPLPGTVLTVDVDRDAQAVRALAQAITNALTSPTEGGPREV